MANYSSETTVEPTWVGWLSIAETQYELALIYNATPSERRRA
jgi:hypothetical protein